MPKIERIQAKEEAEQARIDALQAKDAELARELQKELDAPKQHKTKGDSDMVYRPSPEEINHLIETYPEIKRNAIELVADQSLNEEQRSA